MSEKPLRILYVLPYTPSPIRVRPFQLIRHLAQLGHEITVVALEDKFDGQEAARRELEQICVAVHIVPHSRWRAAGSCALSLPTRTPLWAAFCQSPPMARLLRTLAQSGNFDVAHVEHLRAAHFARDLHPLPLVLDAVDCITALRKQMLEQGAKGAERILAWEEWAKLRRYEPRIYRPFQKIAATSAHDADAITALDPAHLPPVAVIPNGVELPPLAENDAPLPMPDTLVFSGKMSYFANEDAACFLLMDVLPRLRRLRPDCKLILAGSSPSQDLRNRADKAGGVLVTGYVDDLRPFIRQASVAVCPMRIGVGIQNKALEAMALARPVVCTPLVARALDGAEATGGLRVADTAVALAERCADWLSRPDMAHTAGVSARHFVQENYQWERAARRFEQLYRDVL